MILLPQQVVRQCVAVFRRALPKPFLAQAATPIHVTGDRDGVHLRLARHDACIEYHHRSPSSACMTFTVPISALTDCDGRGGGTVRFEPLKNRKVLVRWEHGDVPYQRECASPDPSKVDFPSWPTRDVANSPTLLAAMREAMSIADVGAGRVSFACVQLRGKQGDVIATDGRQLLIHRGFQFPWKDQILLSRTTIFAAPELAPGNTIRVAQTKTHVLFRIGAWTIALPANATARFPKVDDVIPKIDARATHLRIADDEAASLSTTLHKLPGAKEAFAPVTLDLGRNVSIRARAEDEKRCTEVALPSSMFDGKAVRVATNRQYLLRALDLGFRSVQIAGADKPFLCQNGDQLYVWVPLDPCNAISPQTNAVRVPLSTVGDKRCRTTIESGRESTPLRETRRRPLPVRRISKPPRVLDSVVNCVRSLWDLIRKQRNEKAA